MPRAKLHDDALRVLLLERAGATLSTQGLAALSLRSLAAECDTSTTAVYSLFGGKPGLLKALLDEAFRRLATRLAAVSGRDDPVEGIVALGLAYRDSALADPHFYDIMFSGVAGEVPRDEESAAAAADAFRPLAEQVDRARGIGRIPVDVDPTRVTTALWATVHGFVSLQLRDLLPAATGDSTAAFETVLRVQLAGWSPAGEASRTVQRV